MSRPQCVGLTVTHKRIVEVISRLAENDVAPTVAELVSALRLTGPSSLDRTLRIMERNGFIEIHGGGTHGKRRSITLSSRAKVLMGQKGVPVLGTIPAGPLSEALQECEAVVDPGGLLSCRPGDFLLVVKGDSMTGDGILPGDRVLLRPRVDPRDGEIAAVHVGEDYDTSLKHFHHNRSRNIVRLRASNPSCSDIIVQANEVRIIGVYRGLVRSIP